MSIIVDRRISSAGTSPSLNNYIKSGTVSNGELSLVSVDNGIESTIEVPQFDISPTTTGLNSRSNQNQYFYVINGITGYVPSPSGLAVDKWLLLTVIYNGVDFKFYENGDLIHTLSESSANFSNTYYLGGQHTHGGFYPKCIVASVLVLNDAPDIHKLIDYQIKKLKSVKVPLYFKQSFLDGRSIVDLESETEQLKQGLYSVHCDDANKSIVFKNKPGNIWHNVIFNNDFDVTHTDNGQSNGFGNSTTIALASSSVSSLTLDGDGKNLIFQNSEGTVNNISQELYTKSEVDALVTGSGGTNVTLNGDYREIFPKFKSNELTFVIAFSTIEIINGSGARNSDVNAPFIEITHNNTTTNSSNQIVAIKRTTARPDKLQVFTHNTQHSAGSNVNSYEDILIDSVVAGARYYLTERL